MAVSFDLSPDGRLLRVTGVGPVDDDELVRRHAEFLETNDLHGVTRVLSDLRLLDGGGITAAGLRAVAELSDRAAGANVQRGRAAIVADRDLAFGLSRMFQAYVANDWAILVTRDLAEAERWLRGEGEPPPV